MKGKCTLDSLPAPSFSPSQYFFHHRNNLDVSSVIKETYRLMESTPADIHPRNMLDDFQPLTRGQYPVFNKYPTYIVEYQSQERERIRQQEVDYLRERSDYTIGILSFLWHSRTLAKMIRFTQSQSLNILSLFFLQ